MLRTYVISLLLLCGVALVTPTYAQESIGSPEEAQAMVEKAIAFYKDVGREAALAEFNNNKGKFVDRDLYVFICDTDGMVIAHGINRGLVNKNMIDLKDVNGVFIVREMIAAAKNKPEGAWVTYTWTNPTIKKLEPKKTWVKPHDGLLFMVGVYDKTRM